MHRLTSLSALLLVLTPAVAQNAGSQNHRLIGGTPASVAAVASSPSARLLVAGGSGAPVGLSGSPNASVSGGPQSTQLPTDILFNSGLE
jgi:hypothetical protein